MSSSSTTPARKPLLSDAAYSAVKHAAAVGLPAAATLYAALASVWHFPDTEQVIATIAAVNVFLGAFMVISQGSYNASGVQYDGELHVLRNDDGSPNLLLAADTPEQMDALATSKDVTLKVVQTPTK